MLEFADEAVIEVRSGKGGNGCVSFRREKYIPHGGPNGGDGGKGGDVVFCVKRDMRGLGKLRNQVVFKARNGADGSSWNKSGKDGDDVLIPVPPGTVVYDAESGERLREFSGDDDDERFVFSRGGKGGWGNIHFKSSTNQAPRFAHQGTPGEIRRLRLELSVMADFGLVGFPNAGKSSLLAAFTNARPKVAPYPFTTKIPNLGALRLDDGRDIIIADIPGIIEGASEGAGLGIKFLKHISRSIGLIFMIDCSQSDCVFAYKKLLAELSAFSPELVSKKRIVFCNKIDIDGAMENAMEVMRAIREENERTEVVPVSVLRGTNMRDAKSRIALMVDSLETRAPMSERKRTIEREEFLSSRSVDESMQTQYPGSEA